MRPRAHVHRGVVEAAGFWIDPRLCGEAEARRRVLALWEPGLAVFHLAPAWLVLLPRAVRCDTRQALGMPLVRQAEVLAGAPFPPAFLARLAPPRGAAVLYIEGELQVRLPGESERVDLSSWLDVSAWCEVEVAALGAPPAPPALERPRAVTFDARGALAVPSEAPELAGVLAALRGRDGSAGDPARGSFLARLAAGWLGRRRRMASRVSLGQAGGGEGALARAVSRPPSRLAVAFDRLLARALQASRLAGLFGRHHAAYIQKMMELFDRGDFEQALRHAIPLSPEVGESLSRIAWTLPKPRQNLSIGLAAHAGSSSVFLEENLYGRLQRLYREAFERLAAEGRVEEATFILAEVLHAHVEAVAFLERHGRLRMAAELAEARELPAAAVVRQWFLAGDRKRALDVARRRGAFGAAAEMLEKSGKALEARAFRLLWGHELAAAGAYAAAVDAVAPVEEGRALARAWIERAVDLGGEAGARMLALGLAWGGEGTARYRERALALLAGEETEGGAARLAFAEALHAGEKTPATATVARAAVRAVLRDAAATGGVGGAARALAPASFRALVALAGDGALKADAQPHLLARPRPWAGGERAVALEIPAADTGARAICAAAFLPDGRAVVALGEGGVLLLTRDGRWVAHFDAPAHRLVVSDHGDRALACALRGETWYLTRLDLASRRAEPWTAARLSAFAESYDGDLWFVASEEGLAAVEARQPRFVASWGVPEARGVLALARNAARCSLLVGTPLQSWSYELPSLTLREREDIPSELGELPDEIKAISPQGRVAEAGVALRPDDQGQESLYLALLDRRLVVSIPLPEGPGWEAAELRCSGDWNAAAVVGREESRVFLVRSGETRPAAEILLGRARQPEIRLQETVLTVTDELGRLVVLDLGSGEILRNLRV